MIDKSIVNTLSTISLAMFSKNFFGIYHGAISAKIDYKTFIINTRDAIFDKIDAKSLCELSSENRDYRWKIASIESHIHANIYDKIHEAKYVAFTMPSFTTAYTFENDTIVPKDYFGKTTYGEVPVYNPGDFNTWYERNESEITDYFVKTRNHIMVIKGVGVYVYDRDIYQLVKRLAILENSCKLLSIRDSYKSTSKNPFGI